MISLERERDITQAIVMLGDEIQAIKDVLREIKDEINRVDNLVQLMLPNQEEAYKVANNGLRAWAFYPDLFDEWKTVNAHTIKSALGVVVVALDALSDRVTVLDHNSMQVDKEWDEKIEILHSRIDELVEE